MGNTFESLCISTNVPKATGKDFQIDDSANQDESFGKAAVHKNTQITQKFRTTLSNPNDSVESTIDNYVWVEYYNHQFNKKIMVHEPGLTTVISLNQNEIVTICSYNKSFTYFLLFKTLTQQTKQAARAF